MSYNNAVIITTLTSPKVHANEYSLFEYLEVVLKELAENSVVAISSKVISLCENRVAPLTTNKEQLISREADYVLPTSFGKYGYHYSIIKNTMIAAAGIDESNADGNYVLWPRNPQKTANHIRKYLKKRFHITNVGVVIVDSASIPLRRGAVGTAIAHSGFAAINDYVGQVDLFGRPFSVSVANILSGLAATAVLAMGEGSERTPLCLIADAPMVTFIDRDPTHAELNDAYIPLQDDLFAPFFTSAPWQQKKPDLDRPNL